ncbi:tetratricopeptide repeat protein [Nannocystis bainbridge]|nr:tetratricopeptide repeat protein [Nannocystis bainbridge]
MSQQQHRSARRRAEKRHLREVERRKARTVARKDGSTPAPPRPLARDGRVLSADEDTDVHPYLTQRERERELVVRGTPWRWRHEMPGFWTHAEVAALADDALFTGLADRGLVLSRADVLAHIARMPAGGSAWRMSRIHWLPALGSRVSAADRDFLGLAAVELWRRLRPEDPPLESLLALLADADDLRDDDMVGCLTARLRFLAAVRGRGGSDSAGEIGGVRLPLGEEHMRAVLMAFRFVEAHPELVATTIAEVDPWVAHVGDSEDSFLARALAVLCNELGHHDEAERRLRAALALRPDEPATRRMLAAHLHEHAGGDRARLVEALELWDSAHRSAEPDDDDEESARDEALFRRIRDSIVESLRAHEERAVDAAE